MATRGGVLLALTALLVLVIVPGGTAEPETASAENRREYVIGGSSGGVSYVCMTTLQFDIGAACDIPCPGGTCDITLRDDIHGTNIGFRVCFDGEAFCRPDRYRGSASVAGTKVTVAVLTEHASHGVVTVR